MLQRLDTAWIARLERAKLHEERRVRLRFPDARAKLKIIRGALDRARAGEAAPRRALPPRDVRIASPITEDRITNFQACHMGRGTWRWFR